MPNDVRTRRWGSEIEAAESIGVNPTQFANWRRRGWGPAYYRPGGGRLVYDLDEVAAWLETTRVDPSRKRTPDADPTPPA